ncbi:MAG: hypothetical protein DMG16_05685 [Acidobacteria bacterium]|nr:MAG: hypothetical protein DMG16_05685 [Acidobacteriota bacterium]
MAERVTKYREASADREAGVVFRSKTKRKTTPAAAASVASQYLIDDAATPPAVMQGGEWRSTVIHSQL